MFRGARRILVPTVATIVVLALAAPALAQARTASGRHRGRAAEVQLGREVRLGRFSEAVVTLWARCRPGWSVEELLVALSQVGGDGGSRTGDPGIVCDGTWQRFGVSVTTPEGGPFGPGWTRVTARLTVSDGAGHTATARDAIVDLVHAQAEVRISRDVRLGQEDSALVTVFVRCERPWVPQGLVVGVSQDEGFTFGSAAGDVGIVCDDRWHRIEVRVFPSGERFHRGLTTVDAAFDVLDPIDFDPVATGTDIVTVFVHAAADLQIARHARLEPDGTLLLPVVARCQEPWVVSDLSVDVFAEEPGVGGSASGDFGLACDGRWHRVEVSVEPVGGFFFPGPLTVHAFLTVLDPISFDPVDQAQDTQVVDTPFANGASNCLEDEDPNRFISNWVWTVSGDLLDQVQVQSDCVRTYTFLTFDLDVNIVIAPGASAIWGLRELTRFGVYHRAVFVGAGNDVPGATSPCDLAAVYDLDYLLEADGTLVPDPCPTT